MEGTILWTILGPWTLSSSQSTSLHKIPSSSIKRFFQYLRMCLTGLAWESNFVIHLTYIGSKLPLVSAPLKLVNYRKQLWSVQIFTSENRI